MFKILRIIFLLIKDGTWQALYFLAKPMEVFILQLIDWRLQLSTTKKENKSDKTIILLPDSPGNLGDEAMLSSLLSNLEPKPSSIKLWVLGSPAAAHTLPDNSFLMPEGISVLAFINSIKRFVFDLRSSDRFILIGADMIDGFYSKTGSLKRILLTSIASRLVEKVSIISASFNTKAPKRIIKRLKKLQAKILVRDSLSFQRLQSYGLTNIEQCLDIAFLLVPEKTKIVDLINHSLQSLKNKGYAILGINPNYLISGKKKDAAVLVRLYVQLIEKLSALDHHLAFLLLVHEYRGNFNDDILAKRIYDQLSTETKNRCVLIEPKVTAAELKALLLSCNFVFTARMHIAIACLSQIIPVAAIEYQEKFAGLFAYFDLVDNLLPRQSIEKSEVLADFIITKIKIREKITKKIAERKSAALSLAKINLA